MMKDIDKIKEKNEKDEVKSILGFILLFLIIFGIITYAIIKLSTQYFALKKELEETKKEQLTTIPAEDGKKIEYKLEGDKIKVQEIKKEAERVAENILREDSVDINLPDNKTLKNEKKVGNVGKEKSVEKKTEYPGSEQIKKEVTNISKNTDNKKTEKLETSSNVMENLKTVSKPPKAVDSDSNFVIQLMAFKDENDAKSAVDKLRNNINDIYYIKADLGEKGTWYRVRCCSSATIEEAKSKLQDLDNRFKIKGFIVKK